MKFIIDDQIVLSHAPEGPLAAHIGSFARSLRELGYSRQSIHREVLLAAGFSRWLKRKRVAARSITSDLPERYLRYRVRHELSNLGVDAALKHLLDFLRRQ